MPKAKAVAQPLRLLYDGRYDYASFGGYPAHCWLRLYAPDHAGDLRVVIAVQMPDNPGTSITNVAGRLAWKVARDPDVWKRNYMALEGTSCGSSTSRKTARRLQRTPKSGDMFREHFSLVSFTLDPDAEDDGGPTVHLGIVDPDTGEVSIKRSFRFASKEPRGSLSAPDWQRLTRARAERLIGQPFPPIPSATL